MDSTDQILDVIESIDTDINSSWAEELADGLNTLTRETTDSPEITSSIKMMRELSRYLNARKAQAYPEALPALKSIGQDIKEMKHTSSPEKQSTIYAKSLATFQQVKSAIESGKVLSEKEREELKAVILSLDWEISDMTMKGFDSVLTRLEERLPNKKVHHIFLRIMHQIGVYIARTKANAHKDAVPLLKSVFQNYEKLANHSDMTPADQKKLVQENISAFNSFKRQIKASPSKETEPAGLNVSRPVSNAPLTSAFPSPPEAPVTRPDAPAGNEDVVPALTHVNTSTEVIDDTPLVTLDDPFADPAPLPAGRVPKNDPPKDIMGELFFPKESPADELLDAIHLANIHGPDQENTPGMSPFMDEKPKQAGMKEFTPRRMDGQPLPEIEQRLDAFFNMDASEPGKAAPAIPETDLEEAFTEVVPMELSNAPTTEVQNESDVEYVVFKLVPESVEGLFLSHDFDDEESLPQNETRNDTDLPMAEDPVTDDETPKVEDENKETNTIPLKDKTSPKKKGFFAWLKYRFRR